MEPQQLCLWKLFYKVSLPRLRLVRELARDLAKRQVATDESETEIVRDNVVWVAR